MALHLIRICAVAAILVMGLMVHDTTATTAHEPSPVPNDTASDALPRMTDVGNPPDGPAPSAIPEPGASTEPGPTAVPEAEARVGPVPPGFPEPEASTQPAPTENPEPEASTEPAPTDVPAPTPSAEPTPSESAPEATADPAPTDIPQAAASVDPAPTAEPIPDAVMEPVPDLAAPEPSVEPGEDLATDAIVVPQPPNVARASHVDSAATADGRPMRSDAELQPSSTSMAAPPAPATATATTGHAAASVESLVGASTVSTEWASIDAPGATRAAIIPALDSVEPVSAGLVVGIAASNRAPAVAVAMEFGRAGSGWAGAIVFNLWLRRQMRERRMSQRQLAVLSGVNHSTVSRLLNHDRQPSLETATKLARALRKAGGELDTADYFERLPDETLFPARRVEMALRGDDLLDNADVERLMRSYLRARESRHGVPQRLVADGVSSSDVEAPR